MAAVPPGIQTQWLGEFFSENQRLQTVLVLRFAGCDCLRSGKFLRRRRSRRLELRRARARFPFNVCRKPN